ncbi:MAG: hypothetical protein NTW17_03345 [Candidatus Pacearchaeota archaeon]|nr:hypothetical protein [Candidatus Pacearchaeota archaeon]
MVVEKNVPTGVKVISILYYIGAVVGIILGLGLMVGAGLVGSWLSAIGLGMIGAGLFIAAGLISLAMGVLAIFIGRGLWKARLWARVAAIVLSCLGILAIFWFMLHGGNILSDLFVIIVQGIMGGYLWFNTEVKKAFA